MIEKSLLFTEIGSEQEGRTRQSWLTAVLYQLSKWKIFLQGSWNANWMIGPRDN